MRVKLERNSREHKAAGAAPEDPKERTEKKRNLRTLKKGEFCGVISVKGFSRAKRTKGAADLKKLNLLTL